MLDLLPIAVLLALAVGFGIPQGVPDTLPRWVEVASDLVLLAGLLVRRRYPLVLMAWLTLVCVVTEFGRTPGGQGAKATGREHNPYAFSVWMAGGGIKGGVVHGKTDELGYHAVEDRHYVTDVHATVLHLLGLDPRKLAVPGRKRLEVDYGTPIRAVMR